MVITTRCRPCRSGSGTTTTDRVTAQFLRPPLGQSARSRCLAARRLGDRHQTWLADHPRPQRPTLNRHGIRWARRTSTRRWRRSTPSPRRSCSASTGRRLLDAAVRHPGAPGRHLDDEARRHHPIGDQDQAVTRRTCPMTSSPRRASRTPAPARKLEVPVTAIMARPPRRLAGPAIDRRPGPHRLVRRGRAGRTDGEPSKPGR